MIDWSETESEVEVRVTETVEMSFRTKVSPTRRSSVKGTVTEMVELEKVAEAWWSGSEGVNNPIMSVGLTLKSKMLSS